MAVYLGSTEITTIYSGSTIFTAMYVGSDLGVSAATAQTLFNHTTQTGMTKAVDTADYIIGSVVRFAENGYVDSISIWKPSGSTMDAGVARTAGIWQFDGTPVMTGSLLPTSEPAAGNWVDVSLNDVAQVSTGTDYILGIAVHNGGYAAQAGGFNSAVINGDITAPATADVSGNGKFRAGLTLNVPNTSGTGSNYWVDCRYFATTNYPDYDRGGYPNASNTGTSGTLTPSNSVSSSANGQTIENLDITGTVTITHNNVTLRNCKITEHSDEGIFVNVTGTGCTVEDCEVDGTLGSYVGVYMQNGGTVQRNYIHGFENGIVSGSNLICQDNFVTDMNSTAADPHYDCFECNGGTNLLIEHNTFINDNTQTSAVMLDNLDSGLSDITVNNNLIVGGGYALYCDGQFAGGAVSDVTISNNRMIPGANGYFAFTSTSPTISGNVNAISLLAI